MGTGSWRKVSWRIENNLVHPRITTAINRSSLMMLCYSFVAMDYWEDGVEFRTSSNWFYQCSGKLIILLIVLMSQLKMILFVVQHALPFLSFLMEANSCQKLESSSSRGQKTYPVLETKSVWPLGIATCCLDRDFKNHLHIWDWTTKNAQRGHYRPFL